jgi:hypothetical protein
VRALLSRWLFFLGLVVAVGAGGFIVLMRGIEPTRPLVLMFGGFLCAFFGAAGLASTHHSLSRADLAYGAGAIVSALGAAVTAIRLFERGLPLLPLPFALLLLPVPAFAGHAFDPGQPRALSVAADVVHLAAASVWVGGLAALAVTRSSRDVVKRYLTVAVASVAVLGTAGVIRALVELTAVSQLWSSGYGRAVLVKTALLAALVGFALSRRIAPAQVVLIGGVIVAVAFLTDLPPGRALAPPASPPVLAAKAPPPPSGSLVLAREAGDLAVAVAVRPAGAGLGVQTSVLGQDGFGVPGLQVRIGSATGSPCGVGCYRATLNARPPVLVIRIGAATAAFRMPRRWPPPRADALVGRTARAYRRLKSVVIHERLASGPRVALETTYELEAPDRLAYQIAGGPAAVVIGSRRWDRLQPGGRWQRSAQTPLPQPTPIWRSAVDAHVLGSARVAGRPVWLVSFLDPSVPAWFTVWIEKSTFRPLELRMTAAAHFMHHRYGSFNAPLRITPPVR